MLINMSQNAHKVVTFTLVLCVLICIVHGPYIYENPPPPPLGIFEDSDFWTPCYMTIQYLLVCTQNIGE